MLENLRTALGNWILPQGAQIQKSYVPPSGLRVIKEFSTPDEPKLADYPRGKYTAYWEIFLDEIPGGFSADVRFYGYGGQGLLETEQFINPNLSVLRAAVTKRILQTMPKYER